MFEQRRIGVFVGYGLRCREPMRPECRCLPEHLSDECVRRRVHARTDVHERDAGEDWDSVYDELGVWCEWGVSD